MSDEITYAFVQGLRKEIEDLRAKLAESQARAEGIQDAYDNFRKVARGVAHAADSHSKENKRLCRALRAFVERHPELTEEIGAVLCGE